MVEMIGLMLARPRLALFLGEVLIQLSNHWLQGKTVEMIALMLARPRPALPAGEDAVLVVPPEVGATSSALSFKCR